MNMKQRREQPWCKCFRTDRASNSISLLLRGQLAWHHGLPRMPAILSALLAAGLVHSMCNASAAVAPIHIITWILLSTYISCVDTHDVHCIISFHQRGGKYQACEWLLNILCCCSRSEWFAQSVYLKTFLMKEGVCSL